jgi:tetratricopeptide (TPR) repeat protein
MDLAQGLARDGQLDEAFRVVAEDASRTGKSDDKELDEVRVRWVEHLIATHNLSAASDSVELIKSLRPRSTAFIRLAIAYAENGNRVQAFELLRREAGIAAKDQDSLILRSIAETLLALDDVDEAKAVVQELIACANQADTWTKARLLGSCAMLTAKAGDRQTSRQLFSLAVDCRNQPPTGDAGEFRSRMTGALAYISTCLATVREFDEALKIAEMVRAHSGNHVYNQVLCFISMSQAAAGEFPAAIRTATMIENQRGDHDMAIVYVVDHQIAREQFGAALATSKIIDGDSLRDLNMLKVAGAMASASDISSAKQVALMFCRRAKNPILYFDTKKGVFGLLPSASWDAVRMYGNTRLIRNGVGQDAEIAAAAMGLLFRLKQTQIDLFTNPYQSIQKSDYAREFGRVYAASGDPNQALVWAREVNRAEDPTQIRKIRVGALIGVAEGILDRTTISEQEPIPPETQLKVILAGRRGLRDFYREKGSMLYWKVNPYR